MGFQNHRDFIIRGEVKGKQERKNVYFVRFTLSEDESSVDVTRLDI